MSTLKLHGFSRSNYYNIAKMALLEKGASFEEVKVFPNQEEEFLAKSPMGKVPCLETEHGCLTETSAILDYVEESLDGPSFYPSDPWGRAKVRELMRGVELYVDLAARPGISAAFFKGEITEEAQNKAQKNLDRGLVALGQTAEFSPYIAGDTFTYADMMAFYCLPLAAGVAGKLWQGNPMEALPQSQEMFKLVAERDSAKAIADSQKK